MRAAGPILVCLLAVLVTSDESPAEALRTRYLPLDYTTAAAFVSGLLFGWLGAVGAAVGAFAGALVDARGGGPALAGAAGAGLAAVLPFAIFSALRGVGRGLPNLRSYLWMLAAAALAAPAAGALRWLPTAEMAALDTWAAAVVALVATVLLAPPLAILADLQLHRWLAPIPGELPARRGFGANEMARLPATSGSTQETQVLLRPGPEIDPVYVGGLVGLLMAVSAVAVPVTALVPGGGHWIVLAYLWPVLWAAFRLGLRGAALAASGGGLIYLAGVAAWGAATEATTAATALTGAALAGISAELVFFGLLGALVGEAREREDRLRAEVLTRNRLLRYDLLRVVQALTNAVEAKDVYTEGHLKRVSEYAVRVGEGMGLSGHQLEMLFFASMLHDIGKIGVPEEILTKRGALTREEARVMQRHPEIGARILRDLDVLRDAAPLVLHHQERYDGRSEGMYPGYPHSLSGDTIPTGSRIIAVVDAFDAMTTDRPYRRALSSAEACRELEREAGKQFDPRVVECFLRVLDEAPWESAEVA